MIKAKMFLMIVGMAISEWSFAATVSIGFKTADLSVQGTFDFVPGSLLKISGVDKLGKPFALEIKSLPQKENAVAFRYKLNREGKIFRGAVDALKNQSARLMSDAQNKSAAVQFETKWMD